MFSVSLSFSFYCIQFSIKSSYKSSNEGAGHVEASEDEESDADVDLARSGRVLHVRLQHALDHPVAAEADEVVDERQKDGWMLK
jgi:hypothetical protein